MVMFLWMIPNPPSRAIAIAMRASVTVSMAAESRGMFSFSVGVNSTVVSTFRGSVLLMAGTSRTSSKVSPVRRFSSSIILILSNVLRLFYQRLRWMSNEMQRGRMYLYITCEIALISVIVA